jgi:predicted dehydrogenase
MRKAVVGLIGTGWQANAQHLPNFTYIHNCQLKTVCDVRLDAAKAAQAKFNIPLAESDYRKILADKEIDGVVIVTRSEQHAELTIAALEAGKHVYVEKPLADSIEQCQAVVEAQRKSGKTVCVGFNRRFAPAYQDAKRLLASHGGARNISYRMSDTYCWSWGKDCPPGTRVFHELCHIFDLFRWLTDAEITSVYAIESRADDESVSLKMSSGAIATIMASGYSTLDWAKEYMTVIAERGGLTVENFVEMRTYGFDDDPKKLHRYKGHFHPDSDWTQRYLFESLGAQAMIAVHAMQPLRFRLEKKEPVEFPDTAEGALYKEFLQHHLVSSYDVDKGWLQAMEHFGLCCVSDIKPEGASAHDGTVAEKVAHAMVKSRTSGMPVQLA